MDIQTFLNAQHGTKLGQQTKDLAVMVMNPNYNSSVLDDDMVDGAVNTLQALTIRLIAIQIENNIRRNGIYKTSSAINDQVGMGHSPITNTWD
jgi:alcohol dehydrogenase YqhD (iron-dependent ADH family)